MFLSMPAEIKVAIIKCLSENTELLLKLCLVNKLFNEIVTPIIYENPNLQCRAKHSNWCGTGVLASWTHTFSRQTRYLQTVEKRPKYLLMARHIGWEFNAIGWKIFSTMVNVRSVDIIMGDISDCPSTPLFPYLKEARLAGIFPPDSLRWLIFPSPSLVELHLVDTVGEAPRVKDKKNPWARSIAPFLDLCVSRPKTLPGLRIFCTTLCIFTERENLADPIELILESWVRFLSHYAHQLEDLRLLLPEGPTFTKFNPGYVFKFYILPVLASGKFQMLRHLTIEGIDISQEDKIQIRNGLPATSRQTYNLYEEEGALLGISHDIEYNP